MTDVDAQLDALADDIDSLPDDRKDIIMGKLEGYKTFTATEVAELLSLSDTTIRRKLRDGEISGVQTGKGWRISRADLEKWWSEQGGETLFNDGREVESAEDTYVQMYASDGVPAEAGARVTPTTKVYDKAEARVSLFAEEITMGPDGHFYAYAPAGVPEGTELHNVREVREHDNCYIAQIPQGHVVEGDVKHEAGGGAVVLIDLSRSALASEEGETDDD